MAQKLEKYFIAIVPEGPLQERMSTLKAEIKERYGAKYALKSPAHITLKMPFLWNEHKEDDLLTKLRPFFRQYKPFALLIRGVGQFRGKILYARVLEQSRLNDLQSELVEFLRRSLRLNEELSDKAFVPHMTVAYNDLKKRDFDSAREFLQTKGIRYNLLVTQVAILKKTENRWQVLAQMDFRVADTEIKT